MNTRHFAYAVISLVLATTLSGIAPAFAEGETPTIIVRSVSGLPALDVSTGQKNIDLFQFTMESQDVDFNLRNVNFQTVRGFADDGRYSLMYDKNGDGQFEEKIGVGQVRDTRIIAMDVQHSARLYKDRVHRFALRAEILPEAYSPALQVDFYLAQDFPLTVFQESAPTGLHSLRSTASSCEDEGGCLIVLEPGPGPVATITIAPYEGERGTASVTFFPKESVYPGQKQERIMEMRVSIDAIEGQTFYSMHLQNRGTAPDDSLKNVALYRISSGGPILLTNVVQGFSDGHMTLEFDPPFTIPENESVMLALIADVESGGGTDLNFRFDDDTDFTMAGTRFGYGPENTIIPSAVTFTNKTGSIQIVGSSQDDGSSQPDDRSTSDEDDAPPIRRRATSSSSSSAEEEETQSPTSLVSPDYIQGYEQDIHNAAWFDDTDPLTLEGKAASALARLGIIGGYPDGEFKGWRGLNRAEVAKFMLYSKYDYIASVSGRNTFPDVEIGSWYENFILFAVQEGILRGHDDGMMRPGGAVTTEELLAMMQRAFDLPLNLPHSYRDVPEGSWFDQYAGIATGYGLFPDRTDRLGAGEPLTRKDTAIAFYNLLSALNAMDSDVVVRSVDLGFSASIPSAVSRTSLVTLGQTTDALTQFYYQMDIYVSADQKYVIAVSTLPSGILLEGTDDELDFFLNGSVTAVPGAELVSSSKTTYKGFPAVEYVIRATMNGVVETVHGRIIVAQRHVYSLAVAPEHSETFLNSFIILPGVQKP